MVGGSGGIGAAVALGLGAAGASVVVHGGSSRERLDATVAAIRGAGGDARGFLLPIASPRAAEDLLREVPEPDVLVCAYGPFVRRPLAALDAADWERATLLDLALPGALASAALSGMEARGWGRILLFGGTCADSIRGFLTTAAYSAAKVGLAVVAKSVAKAAAGSGVTCNMVCPGLVDTEYLDEAVRASWRERAPGGRLLEPAEVARAALALLSNPAANGAVVAVDGGLSL